MVNRFWAISVLCPVVRVYTREIIYLPKSEYPEYGFLLKNELIWTCRSVVSVVIFIEFEYFSSKVCNPFFSILLEFPAVLTWTTKKSTILFRSVLIKLYVPYLALYPGESLRPSPIKLFSSLVVQILIFLGYRL